MFDLIVILMLAALAFPVIAIALVKVLGLTGLVLRLESRVSALERELAPREAVSSQTPATSTPPPLPIAPR
jgi:hypothetical protein